MGNEVNLNPQFIFNKLDESDGKKDNKISASVWNQFAKICGGNAVKESINNNDAIRSIGIYLERATADTKKKIAQFLGLNNQNNNQNQGVNRNRNRSLMPDNTIPNDEPGRVAKLGRNEVVAPAVPVHNVSQSSGTKKNAKAIADAWAETFGISNKNGEFTKFVERLYDIAKQLNITKTNSGSWDKTTYPTKEDQIVDELMAVFAGESSFNPKAKNGGYRGIFQLDQMSLDSLNMSNKVKSIDQFANLSRIQQLDYFVAHINLGRSYSKMGNQPISSAEAWRLVKFPAYGNPSILKEPSKSKAIKTLAQKQNAIKTIQGRRNEIRFC